MGQNENGEAIKEVRSEEMGLKKHRMCSKCRDRHSNIKLTVRKEK